MDIKKLLQAGEVVRYHNHSGIDKQTLAQHQWGVAMIVHHLEPHSGVALLMTALTHDLAEYHTGDLPAPVKWSNPQIKEMLDKMEDDWLAERGVKFLLSPKENFILSLADKFEGMWFCVQQMKNGHQAARRPFRLWAEAAREMLASRPHLRGAMMLDFLEEERNKWDISK